MNLKLVQLDDQSIVAHFIECLGDIKNDNSGVLLFIKPVYYICDDSCNLLDSRLRVAKFKLCVRDD